MCGFAGVMYRASQSGGDAPGAVARTMATMLIHRGPDDFGVWEDASAGIGFGFRRLAILDLTPTGKQPMTSPCGRYVLVFNGEIYNHQSLKYDLEAQHSVTWHGHSDTEILLAALAHWGIEDTLARVDGMYAFALWDKHDRRLYLARDPFGEKPLYYGVDTSVAGGRIVFASELKAIFACPGFQGRMNDHALALFLRHRYVPSPHSILQGIHKVPPGAYVCLRPSDRTLPKPIVYWDNFDEAKKSAANPFAGRFEDALDVLDDELRHVVAERRIADVPVGVFLSGGVDSSLIAAMMAQESGDVQSYTIGFTEQRFDESPFAKRVAEHLGTHHHETILSPSDALAIVPELPCIYDEPFADASQIPTILLARSATKNVKVALSGDGGDEMFLGYPRYLDVPGMAAKNARRSPLLRGIIGEGARALPYRWRRKLENFSTTDVEQLYIWRTCAWRSGLPMTDLGMRGVAAFETPMGAPSLGLAQRLALRDAGHALADDLQVKIDRASMSASLETRAPLLSRRIARLAWSFPEDFNISPDDGCKRTLRRVLHRYVPKELVERPKAGFEPPVRVWLKGALKDWGEDLLSDLPVQLDQKAIRQAWQQHQSGRGREGDLWPVFMLQAWRRRWNI